MAKKVSKTAVKWIQDSDARTCIGEALGADGAVLARVRIRAEHEVGADFRTYNGPDADKIIESDAQDLARRLAESPS